MRARVRVRIVRASVRTCTRLRSCVVLCAVVMRAAQAEVDELRAAVMRLERELADGQAESAQRLQLAAGSANHVEELRADVARLEQEVVDAQREAHALRTTAQDRESEKPHFSEALTEQRETKRQLMEARATIRTFEEGAPEAAELRADVVHLERELATARKELAEARGRSAGAGEAVGDGDDAGSVTGRDELRQEVQVPKPHRPAAVAMSASNSCVRSMG